MISSRKSAATIATVAGGFAPQDFSGGYLRLGYFKKKILTGGMECLHKYQLP